MSKGRPRYSVGFAVLETMSALERERRVVKRKGPTTCSISCLVEWRILLKDENEPYLKVYQEVMFHSFVEVDERNEETMQIFRSQFGSRGFSV